MCRRLLATYDDHVAFVFITTIVSHLVVHGLVVAVVLSLYPSFGLIWHIAILVEFSISKSRFACEEPKDNL
uniref:Uncharacterized protein n=1 Tax=Arundo donax TaxID=35708 RepID=A0A0A9BZT2_ARUDO